MEDTSHKSLNFLTDRAIYTPQWCSWPSWGSIWRSSLSAILWSVSCWCQSQTSGSLFAASGHSNHIYLPDHAGTQRCCRHSSLSECLSELTKFGSHLGSERKNLGTYSRNSEDFGEMIDCLATSLATSFAKISFWRWDSRSPCPMWKAQATISAPWTFSH